SSTHQTPPEPKRHDTPCNDEKLLKVFSINSLKKHDKPEKAKMKIPEQTIKDINGNFLKRQFKLYKSEKPLDKQTKGISF
ncbi:MAG: hypothetical protein OEY94_07545, partial [Alphaproteobacteria bacterium]|nr:hypothetical protein [Alphaproteobacteria bacterium]